MVQIVVRRRLVKLRGTLPFTSPPEKGNMRDIYVTNQSYVPVVLFAELRIYTSPSARYWCKALQRNLMGVSKPC